MLPYYETINGDFTFHRIHNLAFPIHFHTQAEMFYVIRGEVEITVDQTTTRLRPGDLGIIFPGLLHEYRELSAEENIFMTIFEPALTPQFVRTLTELKPELPVLRADLCHPDIYYALTSLDTEVHSSSPNLQVYPIFLQLMMTRVLPALKLQKRETNGQNHIIYRVTDYLTHHFMDPITLSDVAAACGISKGYLSRVFAQQIGIPFPLYLNRLRINEAQAKLQETTLSITEIAYMCGFESPRTFNRNFAKIVGITPSEYRSFIIDKII